MGRLSGVPMRLAAEYLMRESVRIIGGGLAGSEAAWQLAERGHDVIVHEMRPIRPTPAHKTDRLAELVCSNTFKSTETTNAHGLLKAEMRVLGPLTSDTLAAAIAAALGVESLAFYDAIAPIVAGDSVDEAVTFRASRYGKETMPNAALVTGTPRDQGEEGAYLNCPMSREQY